MMGTTAIWVYAIGFLAQGFFSARMLLQWGMSEKAHRVVSPNIYWICSLVGSILLFAYGWLRNDFAIILGQMISYYISSGTSTSRGCGNGCHGACASPSVPCPPCPW